jgi:hypothetical protein
MQPIANADIKILSAIFVVMIKGVQAIIFVEKKLARATCTQIMFGRERLGIGWMHVTWLCVSQVLSEEESAGLSGATVVSLSFSFGVGQFL